MTPKTKISAIKKMGGIQSLRRFDFRGRKTDYAEETAKSGFAAASYPGKFLRSMPFSLEMDYGTNSGRAIVR